jgi:signal transduction histidine kinase
MRPETPSLSRDSSEVTSGQTSPWLVELAVRQTATQAERLWAWIRVLFCGLAFLVFASNAIRFHPPTFVQLGAELLTFLLALLFSTLVLGATRTRLATSSLHRTSVILDAVLVGVALGSNQFVSDGSYHGILMSLDVAVAPLVVTTSLIRIDLPSVWTSSGLVAIAVGFIVAVDATAGLPTPEDKLLLLLLYHASATFVAYFATRWLRVTVQQATLKAVRSERARGGLMTLLGDHHNLRSTLTSLQLNGDRLALELERGTSAESVAELVIQIQRSVERIGSNVHDSQAQALAWLDQTEDARPADLVLALRLARERVRLTFPRLEVRCPARTGAPIVFFGGGTAGLERVLESVLQNAAEGSLGASATTVSILINPGHRGGVIVDLVDDGPGFPDNLAAHVGQRGYSTKPGSLGLGLWLVHSAMLAAGGRLELIPTASGAHVRLHFARAL